MVAALRVLVAVTLVFAAGLAIAWVLRSPVPAGTLASHLVAAALGIAAGLVIGGIAAHARVIGRRSGPVVAAMVALLLVTMTPSSAAAARSVDFEPNDCPVTSYSAKLEASLEFGPLEAGPKFEMSAIEHPKDRWSVEMTVGFEMDLSYDLVPLEIKVMATAAGGDLRFKIGGRGAAEVVNHYEFTSQAAMELAVKSAYARVATQLAGFPGLGGLAVFQGWAGPLPPTTQTEYLFGTGAKVEVVVDAGPIAGISLVAEKSWGSPLATDGCRQSLEF